MGQGSAPYTVWASERTGILLINSVVLLNATAAISLYLSYHLSIICHQPKNISQDQDQLPGLCQHMHGSWPLHCLIDEALAFADMKLARCLCFQHMVPLNPRPLLGQISVPKLLLYVTASHIVLKQSHGDSSFVLCVSET